MPNGTSARVSGRCMPLWPLSPLDGQLSALRLGGGELAAELVERPVALREDAAEEREARRAVDERERIHADVPRRERLEAVVDDLRHLAGLDVAHAEVQRQAVVELQPEVVGEAVLLACTDRSPPRRPARLLLRDERLDDRLHLGLV